MKTFLYSFVTFYLYPLYFRYDKKMVDLHDKVQLLSDDIEKSDDDYNRIKKNLDNQLFLNKVSF